MAKTDMQVKFLRGLQAQLPTSGHEGSFYLTTDTDRLYVGKSVVLVTMLMLWFNKANVPSCLPTYKRSVSVVK